ncbi:MAG: exonuclease RecJ [Halobacteriales archaeon]
MSVEGRSAEPSAAVAGRVREAGFVRLVARADGDALAAAGLLARASRAAGVPFQVSVAVTDAELADRLDADGLSVTVGADPARADLAVTGDPAHSSAGVAATGQEGPSDDGPGSVDRPASATAAAVANDLGGGDPVLALAGVVAAGHSTAAAPELLERAEREGLVRRRPGVGVPTADPAAGLARSTLVHAPFSARPDAAAAVVEAATDAGSDSLNEDARRQVASLVAVETAGHEDASERAAAAVERALRPHETPAAPFATLAGYAEVLDALARAAPGTGVALALSGDAREAALDVWRDHARRAHEGLRAAATGRYEGLVVARVEDAPVATTARMLADFRSPEPAALVVADGEAAVVARPGTSAPTDALREAAADLDGDAGSLARGSYARFDATADAFVTAFREAEAA